jgi:predicted Zn-dependent protease with MMP-like domain
MGLSNTVSETIGAARAPTLDDIEALARTAYAGLPSRFTSRCEGLVIKIEDWPDDDSLDEMECESEYDLLGLFRGQGTAQREHLSQTGDEPNMIWLFRRPILDFWAESELMLAEVVTHVLVHEIGHHFGFSDEDMEEIEGRVG